ncbi:hypothetical protein [Streptomyces aidingensis]|uniref:Uncharacterized protein n=1 Tax=Streptomyces aidingensis TaxID=910347 RepID=A0A1I1QN38_9ACTN|nr:hypothetical protein [Streptomyces aidingensis]SFD21268.1 hypothetical protein SAMN05421773_111100 [Streptomyces aidingensis]
MQDPNADGPAQEQFDPDAALWTPGVDYVAGWRDARAAVVALADALRAAGVDADAWRVQADTAADGSGRVRLVCSSAAARRIALLVSSGREHGAGQGV